MTSSTPRSRAMDPHTGNSLKVQGITFVRRCATRGDDLTTGRRVIDRRASSSAANHASHLPIENLAIILSLSLFISLYKTLISAPKNRPNRSTNYSKTSMSVNIPLVVIGSIVSCLAISCILKGILERSTRKAKTNPLDLHLAERQERESKIQHLQKHYHPHGRRVHNSIPLRNPAYYQVNNAFRNSVLD